MTFPHQTVDFDLSRLSRADRGHASHLITAVHGLIRGMTRDDLVDGDPVPKHISLGKVYNAREEGRQDGPVFESRETLRPHHNFVANVPIEAEPGPTVYSLGKTFPERDVELTMRVLGSSRDEAIKTLKRMNDSDRAEWLKMNRSETADAAARLERRNHLDFNNNWKANHDAYAARRNAVSVLDDQAHTETADRSVAPGRAQGKYDPLAAFKANMDRAHQAARGA